MTQTSGPWLEAMVACSEAAAAATDENRLVEQVCRSVVEIGGCERAWIFWNEGDAAAEPLQGGFGAVSGGAAKPAGLEPVLTLLTHQGRTCGIMAVTGDPAAPMGDHEKAFMRVIGDGVAVGISALRSQARYERANAAKRLLYKRFVRAEEAERRRVVRDLHDTLGQSCTVLKLLAYRAMEAPVEVNGLLKEMDSVVDEMVVWYRDFMTDFGSQTPDEPRSLAPTLAACFERYSRRTSIPIDFEYADVPEVIPEEICSAVHRVVQEALTNVVRHAGATRVGVELTASGGKLHLQIRDNGKGFTPTRKSSFGLAGMQERVELLGGEFRLESHVGTGTHIAVTLPGG